MLPTPKMPKATPCCVAGNHLEVKLTPTAKLEPADPRRKPQKRSEGYECIRAMPDAGMMPNASNTVKMSRPPYRSARIPMGMRRSDPRITGIAIITEV
jgi:hypothetical protein